MKMKVLNLDGVPDGKGDTYTKDSVVLLPRAIPVTRNFEFHNSPLGEAILSLEDNALYAEVVLFSGVKKSFTVVPAVGGVVLEREGGYIKKIQITSIGLCDEPNQDPRIQAVIFEDERVG